MSFNISYTGEKGTSGQTAVSSDKVADSSISTSEFADCSMMDSSNNNRG